MDRPGCVLVAVIALVITVIVVVRVLMSVVGDTRLNPPNIPTPTSHVRVLGWSDPPLFLSSN